MVKTKLDKVKEWTFKFILCSSKYFTVCLNLHITIIPHTNL
jgi:hypothetical protein